MENRVVELDVREDIGKGEDPFQKIMETILTFGAGDKLVLQAPFQPIPLYGVLKGKGFEFDTEELGDKHWKIIFTKKS